MTVEISELLDDAIEASARERVLDALRRQDAGRRTWGEYCIVGDALRGLPCLSRDFTARTMARLADEPTVLAPAARPRRGSLVRVALPVAASVLGVAVVAWVAQDSFSPPALEVASVQAPLPAAPASVAAVPAADAPRAADASLPGVEVTPYLFVHSGYVPSRTMQGVAPYVRVVSEGASGGGR